MSLIVANATSNGARAGLMTIAGNSSGLIILVTIATLGMSSIMAFVAEWFHWIRWVGALYLIWLGISRIREVRNRQREIVLEQSRGPNGYFTHGLIVAVSNPKVLLFLGAFFPQFIEPTSLIGLQLFILAVLFVIVLTVVDILIVLTASHIASKVTSSNSSVLEYFTGGLLIFGGIWLAAIRKS